jgi:predicted dehydrogenase
MPPRSIRVGVIGTGFGRRVVAPTFTAVGCEVVDVVSARDDKAVAELCRRDVDLVSVHSPPFLHAAHVRQALAGGHAVLCDKPLGTSAAQSAELAAEARDAGVVNLVNFEFRHEPARVRLKQLLDEGAIGRPEHVHWLVANSVSRVPLRPFGWLFQASFGGGWIGAWASHAVDAVRYLFGEVQSATATRYLTVPVRPDRDGEPHRCDAEDGLAATLTLASGATVAIDSTFAAPVTLPTRLTVLGASGSVEVVNDRVITQRRPDGDKQEEELPRTSGDPHGVAMHRWAEEVRDAVADGRQIGPSFEDGLACARVLDVLRAGPLVALGPG